MKKQLIFTLSVVTLISCSGSKFIGIYSNKNGTTISLNEDSTYIYSYRFDLFNHSSSGTWEMISDKQIFIQSSLDVGNLPLVIWGKRDADEEKYISLRIKNMDQYFKDNLTFTLILNGLKEYKFTGTEFLVKISEIPDKVRIRASDNSRILSTGINYKFSSKEYKVSDKELNILEIELNLPNYLTNYLSIQGDTLSLRQNLLYWKNKKMNLSKKSN